MDASSVKAERMLDIYLRLDSGKVLSKKDLAKGFGVNERSIQRDMDALRCFFEERSIPKQIIYDRKKGGYLLNDTSQKLFTPNEILAVCKILIDSRSLRKDEMLPIINKLTDCCISAENKNDVQELLANEKFHYIEPHHKKHILDGLWEIGQAIKKHQVMEIEYGRIKDHKWVKRRIEPVGIMFSEYYFYLTAFLQNVDREVCFENKDDCFPTIYRLDRIQSFKVTEEHFYVPYKDRFEEGEFRRRVQFMFGGKLEKIRFKYIGPSVDTVLDRLPTARILSKDDQGWEIEAEVFGKGIQMWLRSQGKYVVMEEQQN